LLDSKPAARPKSARYERPSSDPVRRSRYVFRWIALVVIAVLLIGSMATGWSVGTALFTPGNDPSSVKLAEWGRDHGLGGLVTGLEALQYRLNPPKTGGAPPTSILNGQTAAPVVEPTKAAIQIQSPLIPVVAPGLPGEGNFKALVVRNGLPIIQVAYLRPDSVHTSYLAAVVWMSGEHTKLVLHPGYSDPGNTSLFSQPTYVNNNTASGLIATFNAGFKVKDSRGGFFSDGHTVGRLTPGAASVVTYNDGHSDVGAWGSEVSLTSDVVSVRQNLKLLIDNGQLSTNLNGDVQSTWGATLGGAYDVWRTGVGITAKGDLVYVIGDSLSVRSLAVLLQRAGAVRAMQLDINKLWASYMWYTPTSGGVLSVHKVLEFERPANRYLSPTSRDFFGVLAR
jgi:hypothetical protein